MKYVYKNLQKIKREIKDKNILLFLDYDGTLSPIVKNPKRAFLPTPTKKILKQLSKNKRFKIAIVSGRALDDVEKLVGIKNLVYAGNHGLELKGPRIRFKAPAVSKLKPTFRRIKARLEKGLSGIKGAFIEDKGLTLTVHYRSVDKESIRSVAELFEKITNRYWTQGKIRVSAGKKVLEVRQPVEWDKGKVVLWLLARREFVLKGTGLTSIYIGDDVTDEDAFKVLRARGITILVGKPNQNSFAQYYLKSTKEVARFLSFISKST